MVSELVVFTILMLSHCAGDVVVQTKVGKIKGLKQPIEHRKFIYQFRKIPYAKPPIGNRRFSKPEAYGSWSGVLDATSYGPSCVQHFAFSPFPLPNYATSEDCLFLNIYVPFDLKTTSNRSVMVWIHGGGLTSGQGMLYDGSYLASHGDVIVVTLNYRLGVLGFFSNEDYGLKGNYGLWDQKMALEWINQNIESFGGNPNSVTIFGSSYGAFCASILSISSVIPGDLFQRVITQSGSAFSPSVFASSAMVKSTSDLFVEIIGCGNITNTTEFLECMSTISADILLMNQGILSNNLVVVDGEIIEELPSALLSNKSSSSYSLFRSRDYLSGFNDADGSSLVSEWITPLVEEEYNFTLANGIPTIVLCDFLGPYLALEIYDKKMDVENTLCEKFTDTKSTEIQGRRIVDLFSEKFYVIPILQLLNIHSDNNAKKTFQYLFNSTMYRHSFAEAGFPWLHGALHGDEIMLFFGFKNFSKNFTDSEGKFVDIMLSYWTNFAKFGDPNGDSLPTWPEYGSEKMYITLNQNVELGHRDFKNITEFWLEDVSKQIPLTPTALEPPTDSQIIVSYSVYIIIICIICYFCS